MKSFERKITESMVSMYAQASGDTNPVHLDEEFAANSFFGTRVAHGMLGLALVCEVLDNNFGHRWRLGSHLKAKFGAPIYLEETVKLHCYSQGVVINSGEKLEIVNAYCTKTDGTQAVSVRVQIPVKG